MLVLGGSKRRVLSKIALAFAFKQPTEASRFAVLLIDFAYLSSLRVVRRLCLKGPVEL